MQFTLKDFGKEDKIRNLQATIKRLVTLTEDTEETLSSDVHLSIRRQPNLKRKKLEYVVSEIWQFKKAEIQEGNLIDEFVNDWTLDKEEEGIDKFYERKGWFEFLKEKLEEGKWFDGRRYWWRFEMKNEKMILKERLGWCPDL